MTIDKSKSEEYITSAEFKDMMERVNKYIKDGGSITDTRRIYINYTNKEAYVTYEQYRNILSRWNSLNGDFDKIMIYVAPVNISNDDKILPIETFNNMEARVNNYLSQGGVISEDRAIFLNMADLKEYITYTRYKDMLKRVELWRKNNNRDPKFVYIVSKTNTNTERPHAVGDNISPNSDGWYLSQRYKSNSASIKQETLWWCADNAMQQLWYELTGNWYSESFLAKKAGTTRNGTGHDGINTALKVLAQLDKVNIEIVWKYLSDLGYEELGKLVKDIDVGTLQHSKYKLRWGHYEYIIGVNPSTKKLLVANSLSGGWLEYRTFKTNTSYVNGCSQKSFCIVTK